MVLDFLWLYFHISILGLVIIREYIRPCQRNLFAILISSVFLILVSGQAWWMLWKFEDSGENGMMHLYQFISLSAARLANLYVGLSVLFFGIIYLLNDKTRVVNDKKRVGDTAYTVSYRIISYRAYMFIYLFVFIIIISLTNSAGGADKSFSTLGLNMSYGVTMYLILLSLGKFPLFYKIISKNKIGSADVVLFFIVIFFTLINARLNVILILLQFIILQNYFHREVSRKALLLAPVIAYLILIVYGLYREFLSRLGGESFSEEQLYYFISDFTDFKIILDWFYGMNVEGFVGLAGVITYDEVGAGISHDFGLSNLAFLTQFIPGSLRTDESLPFYKISEFIRSIYPYQNGSVIKSGLEIAYCNFSVIGVVLFGGLLGYFTQFFHRLIIKLDSNNLNIAIISVQTLNLIRGTVSNALFFGISDLFMLFFYRQLLSILQSVVSRFITRQKSN